MRVVLSIIFLFFLAEAKEYTQQLYEKLLSTLYEVPIVVYVDKTTKDILHNSKFFLIKNNCDEKVDLLIGSRFEHLPQSCKNKPLFATTYKAYTEYPNAIGAFYWRKGRPQIHFKKAALKQFRLRLPKKLQRFINE